MANQKDSVMYMYAFKRIQSGNNWEMKLDMTNE